MVRAQLDRLGLQHFLEERLGLGVLTLLLVQRCQVELADVDLGIERSKGGVGGVDGTGMAVELYRASAGQTGG